MNPDNQEFPELKIPVVEEALASVPEPLRPLFMQLLRAARTDNCNLVPFAGLIVERGFVVAVDIACASSSDEYTDLKKAVALLFSSDEQRFVASVSSRDLAIDVQIVATKWAGDQFPVQTLLSLLQAPAVPLRWWAAYHLAHINAKSCLLAGATSPSLSTDGRFGATVRQQVFEVIVRQALAGAPWQMICAGPMQVNNISEADVYGEVVRRGGSIGFGITSRHIKLPSGNLPELSFKLDEDDYQRMWRLISEAVNAITSWSCPGERSWQMPQRIQTRKVFVDCAMRAIKANNNTDSGPILAKWQRILQSTNTDKEAAERALGQWYHLWRGAPPTEIRWFASPFEAAKAVLEKSKTLKINSMKQADTLERVWLGNPGINMPVTQAFPLVRPVVSSCWDVVRNSVPLVRENARTGELRERLLDAILLQLIALPVVPPGARPPVAEFAQETVSPSESGHSKGQLNNWVSTLLGGFRGAGPTGDDRAGRAQEIAAWNGLRGLFGADASAETHDLRALASWSLRYCFAGQFEGEWLAQGEHANLLNHPFFQLLGDAALNCGFWWDFEDCLMVSEKPVELHIDNRGRLHSTTGPAIRYSDGWELYFFQNVSVPSWLVLQPEQISVASIETESNVELRRVMLEQYGIEKYIRTSGAQIVQEDEFGILYRKAIANDEPLVMVKVVNSTAEPDGTYREYFLRVPPNTMSARAAVAWTFGLGSQEYDITTES